MWLGAGDIAELASAKLLALGLSCTYVTRSGNRYFTPPVKLEKANLSDPKSAAALAIARPDYCIASFTPRGRRQEDYDTAYLTSLRNILREFARIQHKPALMIFVSSTSVYHQSHGELVDEQSETRLDSVSSSTMLECEALLASQGFPTCTVRFSGIYGHGRYHLLNQVRSGNQGGEHWTNRIHAIDCAGVISHLIERSLHKQKLPPVLLATDDSPIVSKELSLWLAERLKVALPETSCSEPKRVRGLGKRCNNSLLKSLGYRLQYPSYKDGFPEIIEAFLEMA